MSETTRRVLTVAVCLLMGCALGVVVTWCTVTGALTKTAQTEEVRAGSKKYEEIMDLVDQYFIGDVDMTQVNDAMAQGVIAGLGDRWSYYVIDDKMIKRANEEGTTVDLTFLRGEEEITFTVERQALVRIPASGRLLSGGVGYIIIDNFDTGCSETVKGLVEDLRSQGAQSLLFDVRNNPGGLKAELTDLLDYLLPEGVVFHTINYAGEEDIVTSDASCVDMPMAVLVNASSYSAAEYFACAIQEYGKGAVVGEHTFGKGYYQVGMPLSDGSCINLSIGKYFTPNGKSLIDVGVTPDIEVELTEEQAGLLVSKRLLPEDDPQLKAALGTLPPPTE